MEKLPPSGPRADRKREAIVRAARTLFLRDGFGVGMDAISAEAGVSKVTVYNHFGSKEALFTAVIAGALDEPLGHDSAAAIVGLPKAEDLRAAFIEVARQWVRSVRANEDVHGLAALVASEGQRFPELLHAWRHQGPTGHHPAVAKALQELADQGRLVIPDQEVAVVQLYSLLVFPHLVALQYGTAMNEGITERMLESGVDMFLRYYAPEPSGPASAS